MAADPTYPLYPIFTLLSATLLLVLLTTNFVRHSWNLGVTFLCFWLFWENLFLAINAIIWTDNADIKLYVYCDIVTHVEVFAHSVKPACTLILTRRLYKIASLRSLVPDSRRAKMKDVFIEWSLGLGLPVLVTSVFYYIVQRSRFSILEGSGCGNEINISGVEILLVESPGLILPMISVVFYCPKIIYVFYRHSRDTNRFLQTNSSVSRSGYFRILALGCLDIFITLPLGIVKIVSEIRAVPLVGVPLLWYDGWSSTHSNWEPVSYSWNDSKYGPTWTIFAIYLNQYSSVILALAIFVLFGLAAESRAAYRRWVFATLKLFGWTPPSRAHETIGELQFRIRSMVGSGHMQTEPSVSVAVSREHAEHRDADEGLPPNDRERLDLEHNTVPNVALRSVSPNIGIDAIFQAENGELFGNSESSNSESSEICTRSVDEEKAAVDEPYFADLPENPENGGPPGLARSPEDTKAARTA